MRHLILVLAAVPVFCLCQVGTAQPPELPDDLRAVRRQIIEIATANTNRTDNIPEIRAQLDPLIAQLEAWFIANRPDDEVNLTQVPWKNLWYDDPDISFELDLGFLQLLQPRDRIFQVVEDGYYYNVSEFVIVINTTRITLQNFLKGENTIARPATDQNAGEARLNTIDLEFAGNSIRFGTLPRNLPLSTLVRSVDANRYRTIPVPGPAGVTGELWNSYIDNELRISPGFDDSDPETIDLYILTRVNTAQ